MEPVNIPIDGILDLHAFNPKDVASVVEEYLWACRQEGVFELRIIHGKGTGVQKARVHSLLSNNPMVKSFTDAPPESGGWGATLVTLFE